MMNSPMDLFSSYNNGHHQFLHSIRSSENIKFDQHCISVVETSSHFKNEQPSTVPKYGSTRIENGDEHPSTYELLRSRGSSPSRRDATSDTESGYPIDENKLRKYYKEVSSTFSGNFEARDTLVSTLSNKIKNEQIALPLLNADSLTASSYSRDPYLSNGHFSIQGQFLQDKLVESRRWLEQEVEDARALAIQQVLQICAKNFRLYKVRPAAWRQHMLIQRSARSA